MVERRVAVFDVDGTLLRGDCLWLAARRAQGRRAKLLAALMCLPWLMGWQLRLVTTDRFKQQMIASFGICEAVNRSAARHGRTDWLLSELVAQLRPEALQRLRWHQQRGDRVLLCSASPRLLLQPLADWLGVELLCTEVEQQQGQWRPRLVSPNCKGPEKVRRLKLLLGVLNELTIEAYGDSKGDRELLQIAHVPHYRSFLPEPQPYPSVSLRSLLPVVALALIGYGLLGTWTQGEELFPLLSLLWPQIGLGLVLVLLGYGSRYGRWRLLLRAVNQHPPLGVDARIWMGSYAFTATPGKSGEAVRSLLLRQQCRVPLPLTLMALLVERLTDALAVLLLLLINLPLLIRWQLPLALFIGITLAALAVCLLLCPALAKDRFRRSISRMLPGNLVSAGGAGLLALRQLVRPIGLLQATVIGALAWGLEGVSLWLLLRGMGIHSVGLGGATIAHTAAGLLGALTLLPGGLGSTELGTVGLLALQGVAVDAAMPATLLIRLMTLWFATALGVACLLCHFIPNHEQQRDVLPGT